MWQDEIDDPEYQDMDYPVKKGVPTIDAKDFFHQPITTFSKNIVNAVTGEDTGYRVGSMDEYRFYVVMENDPNNGREARRLYFDSPTQYEIATGRTVSKQRQDRFYQNQKQFLVQKDQWG